MGCEALCSAIPIGTQFGFAQLRHGMSRRARSIVHREHVRIAIAVLPWWLVDQYLVKFVSFPFEYLALASRVAPKHPTPVSPTPHLSPL